MKTYINLKEIERDVDFLLEELAERLGKTNGPMFSLIDAMHCQKIFFEFLSDGKDYAKRKSTLSYFVTYTREIPPRDFIIEKLLAIFEKIDAVEYERQNPKQNLSKLDQQVEDLLESCFLTQDEKAELKKNTLDVVRYIFNWHRIKPNPQQENSYFLSFLPLMATDKNQRAASCLRWVGTTKDKLPTASEIAKEAEILFGHKPVITNKHRIKTK